MMENLKEYLLSRFPDAKTASGGRQVVLRCRFCGDSQKDKSARHLYIKVDGDVPLYKCFKCNTSGILNSSILQSFLHDYNENDIMIGKEIDKFVSNSKKEFRAVKNDVYNLFNTALINESLANIKLNYLNQRLGLNLSISDCLNDKIVLNVMDFLQLNRINTFTRSNEIMDILQYNTLGFLSRNNSSIMTRSMSDTQLHPHLVDRYNSYTIFPCDSKYKFYTIPTMINLGSNIPVEIHIAEGPIDILSICYNLNHNNRYQQAYVSVNGSDYMKGIKYYLTEVGVSNPLFHIYPDEDKVANMENIIYRLKSLCFPVCIHRNVYPGEKDMGVPLNRINEDVRIY